MSTIAPARTALLEARGLGKTYRRGPEEVHALHDVTLSLNRGQFVALIGRSGSGKTTLLNVLCGWEQPDSGQLAWMDEPPDVMAADRPWSEIAIVPQGLGLMEELSVRENVELPVRLGRTLGREEGLKRVQSLLLAFGLAHLADRTPAEVSIGEQQRTALARALVLKPALLLADEPTGHQDEGWTERVFRVLRIAADRGVCCLVATHNRVAARFADRIIEIRDGAIQVL